MSFDYSKLATLKPKLTSAIYEDTVATGVGTPALTPVATGVTTPVATPVAAGVPIERASGVDTSSPPSSPAYLDATHTLSEQKIYSVMYRADHERHWGYLELSRLTGIRSDTTIRRAIDGLIAKLSIEVTAYQNGNRLGPRYRVYTPKEIAQRRRRAGLEIDPQSKRILSDLEPTPAATGVATPVTSPVATGVIIYGGTPVDSTGVYINKKSDDDKGSLLAALLSLAPTENEEAAETAASDILDLVVAELEAAAKRSSEPPMTARFGVECIRRALRRGDGAPRRSAVPTAVEAVAPAEAEPSVYELRTIAARLFERHRDTLGFTHDRLAELVADALAAQGRTPDRVQIEEAIKGMAV